MDRITDGGALLADPGQREGSGLLKAALGALSHRRPPRAFHDDCHWLEGAGHHLVLRRDSAYPELLTGLPEPPPLLYLEGQPDALQAGRETARAFARDLAGCGFTIVSGLARGIDGAAHRAPWTAAG